MIEKVIVIAVVVTILGLGIRKYYKIFTGKRSACSCGNKKNTDVGASSCDCGCGCSGCSEHTDK